MQWFSTFLGPVTGFAEDSFFHGHGEVSFQGLKRRVVHFGNPSSHGFQRRQTQPQRVPWHLIKYEMVTLYTYIVSSSVKCL